MAADSIFRERAIVLFDQDGQSQLGAVSEAKEKKIKIVTMRGRTLELAPARLDLMPGTLPPEFVTVQQQAEYLLQKREQAQEEHKEIPVRELWNIVIDDAKDFTGSELTEIYYGDNSLEHHLALRFAINDDRIYFKRKKHLYTPRTEQTVEELHKAEEAKLEKERLLSVAIDECIAASKKENSANTFSSNTERILSSLEKIAAGGSVDPGAKKELQNFLEIYQERAGINLSGSREEQAYRFLTLIGRFHRFTNTTFIRHGLPDPFTKEELDEAEKTRTFQKDKTANRRDLRDLEVFTIDDASTQDMDDGLSLEVTKEGYRIGIHITDIASLISKDSLLDQMALQRATSLYFPEKTIHMFPDAIAKDAGSLLKDQERYTVTCFVEFSKVHEIINHEICLSLIRSHQKMNYDEVDQLLNPPAGEIGTLYELSMAYASLRLARGGKRIPKKAARVVLSDPNNLSNTSFEVEEYSESTPSRQLIGEMMILCNESIARFADQHNIPFLYRSQEQADQARVDAVANVPEGPAYDAALRGTMKRSIVSTEALPHAMLGVECYGQVTSPIRRYTDLINQRQIVAFLSEQTLPYSAEDLNMILAETSETMQRGRVLQRDTHRMWMLRHLKKKQQKKQDIIGTIVRDDGPQYQVELEEVFIPCLLKASAKLRRGDRILCTIQAVDPRYDYLKLGFKDKLSG